MIVIAGALAGLGVAVLVAGFTRPSPAARALVGPRVTSRQTAPVAAGVAFGGLVLVTSGWPTAGVGTGVLVGIVTGGLLGRQDRPKIVEARLEAIAAWCEQLRDLLGAGALLYPAIATTAATCPPPIRPAVITLAARLEREQPETALRRFADELDDPAGDLVASVLVTATSHAGNTAELLSELASLTRDRVERRKQIEAGRAASRMDMRLILAVCTVTIVTMIVFARSTFLHPYATFAGQLVLVGIFALFIVAVVWTRRLATYTQPARFLTIDRRDRL